MVTQRFPLLKEIPSIPWVAIDKSYADYNEVETALCSVTDLLTENRARFSVEADALLERGDPSGAALAMALQGAHYVTVTEQWAAPFWPNAASVWDRKVPTLMLHNVGSGRLPMRTVLGRLFFSLCGDGADVVLRPSPTRGFWAVGIGDRTTEWLFIAWHTASIGRLVVQPVGEP